MQPLLRIYREEAPGAAKDEWTQHCRVHPGAAVGFSALVHLGVLGGASVAVAMAASGSGGRFPGVPDHPLHTVFVALVLAQCGLGAVFFARNSWPIHRRTAGAGLLLGCLWLLLVGTLETTNQTPVAAGAWAGCLLMGAVATWAFVMVLELAVDYEPAAAGSRYGLLQLLICTTVTGIILGWARILATRYGFALAEVPEWDFFWHVQLAGAANAALASGVYASLRLPRSWTIRALLSLAVVAVIAFAVPLMFLFVFSKNESLSEMRWLFGSEGLFLIATLVPLQILSEEQQRVVASGSAGASPSQQSALSMTGASTISTS